jgi:hypothetical protein
MADIGTLTPEQMLQQQQILRQQKMAEMLMQRPAPQGQMIGNRYVAPSFTQNLANLANLYVGKSNLEDAEQKQLAMAKAIREQGALETQRLMNTFGGKAAVPEQVTEMAGPYGISGAGQNVPMPTATIQGTPATPANPKLAYAEALNMQSPQARALLPFLAAEAFKKPKWEKAEYTDEKTGKTRQGVIDVNSPDPISTFQVGGTKPEMSAYEKASLGMRGAELADQGIGGYGGYGGGQPQGVPMGQPQGQAPFTPSTLPTYQNDPMLTPKQNRELAMKFSEKQGANVTNAKDSFDLMKEAGKILSTGAPSSGALSNLATYVGEAVNLPFGARKQESEADASLKMLSGALTMKQPRFEGPQGVLDVTLYQKLAGDLGNANIPIESRLATMKQMVTLQKKYFPNGDWDSIETTLKDTGKVSLGPKKGEVDFGSLPTGRR